MGNIKRQSKQIVLNNKVIMGEFIGLALISIFGAILNLIPLLGGILYLILTFFILAANYGLAFCYAADEGDNRSSYFSEIKRNCFKFVKIYLWFFLKVLGLALIFGLIIGIPFGLLSFVGFAEGMGLENFALTGILALILGIIVLIAGIIYVVKMIQLSLNYSLSFFMAFDDDFVDVSAKQCLKICKEMMDGHKMEFLLLQLSFILWILLGCITVGLAYIFVSPYMLVTYANYYFSLKDQVTISRK